MKINRRSFLRGALSATVLLQCDDGLIVGDGTEAPRTEFPVLRLELCGKYPGEEGPQVITHLSARRMVTVEEKLLVAHELTMDQLRELMEARVSSWCGFA